jgi:thiamine-monophosphate kinase
VPLPEKALIERIRRMAESGTRGRADGIGRPASRSISIGIGDDCAILRLLAGQDSRSVEALVTTDFTLETVHFRREWHPAESAGHRCLARGLSDIAAMGGQPVAAFLSLALPRDLPQAWADRFARGLMNLAEGYKVTLAGGDTAQSPDGILADIVVVGTVPSGEAILRSGARPGDRIYVTGELGGSAAAIVKMRKFHRKVKVRDYPRHFYPEPRVEIGRTLREQGWATAMIDLSDGLSTDLAHICEESGVGAEVEALCIPRARVGKPAREVDLRLALHGGEDYELLFTGPPDKRIPSQIAGVALTSIGRITRGKKVFLRGSKGVRDELVPHGWEYFQN